MSVVVPIVVPFTTTVAPMTGLFSASFTVPFTVTACCAQLETAKAPSNREKASFLFMINYLNEFNKSMIAI